MLCISLFLLTIKSYHSNYSLKNIIPTFILSNALITQNSLRKKCILVNRIIIIIVKTLKTSNASAFICLDSMGKTYSNIYIYIYNNTFSGRKLSLL